MQIENGARSNNHQELIKTDTQHSALLPGTQIADDYIDPKPRSKSKNKKVSHGVPPDLYFIFHTDLFSDTNKGQDTLTSGFGIRCRWPLNSRDNIVWYLAPGFELGFIAADRADYHGHGLGLGLELGFRIKPRFFDRYRNQNGPWAIDISTEMTRQFRYEISGYHWTILKIGFQVDESFNVSLHWKAMLNPTTERGDLRHASDQSYTGFGLGIGWNFTKYN